MVYTSLIAERFSRMDFAGRSLDMRRCHVMGVLNVTPDSFSDGGKFSTVDEALSRAGSMVAEGASIIDVGGESTRPGAAPVSAQEEVDRVCPVVERLVAELDVVVSVDTSSAEVIRESTRLGAGLVNDVRALTKPGALDAAVVAGVPVCLMHMQGQPADMQDAPQYDRVVGDVSAFLGGRAKAVTAAGVPEDRIIIDPGFCFGKTLNHNLELLAGLSEVMLLGYPMLVGVSRKSMLGQITGRGVNERMPAGLAVATLAALAGTSIIRTHDVWQTLDAIRVVSFLRGKQS